MNKIYAHLTDYDFLNQIYNTKIRVQYAKIVLLSFNEKPIKEIQGIISSGSLSINGSSAVRRTVNLTVAATTAINDLTNIDNEISINKKIKLEIGLKNPFNKYEKVLWFPMGIFTISTANISYGTNGCNISITAKDKMSKLDGTIGGSLLSTLEFHVREELDSEGEVKLTYPTIYQIIMEAVHHFGEEDLQNIFIDDIDETAQILIKYSGSDPIWFNNDYSGFTYNEETAENHKILPGQNVGYRLTEFTYPGELVLSPGETIVTLLDKIAKTLGNFEYYYDVWGKFHFQKVRSYINEINLLEKNENIQLGNYFMGYNNDNCYFLDDRIVSQINANPKYDNIKNDFAVIGKRTDAFGEEHALRYHVMIEQKPKDYLNTMYCKSMGRQMGNLKQMELFNFYENEPFNSEKYFDPYRRHFYGNSTLKGLKEISEYYQNLGPLYQNIIISLPTEEENKKIWEQSLNYKCSSVIISDENGTISSQIIFTGMKRLTNKTSLTFPNDFFEFETSNGMLLYKYNFPEKGRIKFIFNQTQINESGEIIPASSSHFIIKYETAEKLYFGPGTNGGWREELYRQAFINQYSGVQNIYEQSELLAHWRDIYDPENKEWNSSDIEDSKRGWNPVVFEDPSQLKYWLDYIDLPEYSISAIGRRSKVVNEDKVNTLWLPNTPSVIFYDISEKDYYKDIIDNGYQAFQLAPGDSDIFINADSNSTALEVLREIIRSHLVYNLQISITCLPMYHLEPNNLIYIYNQKAGIEGKYQISQFNLPLTYNGTMSITATEVLNKY